MASGVETPPTREQPAAPAAPRPPQRVPVATVAVAAAIVVLSFQSGTYDVLARNPVAIAIWWALLLGVGTLVWPLARPPRAALAAGGLLAAYAALTALSIAWAGSAAAAFDELNRVTLFLGAFALVVAATRRGGASRMLDGVALGTAAIGLLALIVRLFPHLIAGANHSPLFPADPRANYPLGYWNGLAVLLALGVAPLLRVATAARRRLLRATAVAVLPAFAAVIDLTLSRGGALAAGLAAILFLALAPRRPRTLAALAAGGAGSAAAVVTLAARPVLSSGAFSAPQGVAQGRGAALLILAACLGAGALYLLAERRVPERGPRVPRRARWALGALALAAVAAGIAVSNPSHALHQFKQPPAVGKTVLSSSGNGRWQMWQAAIDEFRAHPVGGGGAGSYAEWWSAHAPFPYFTKYAHSLYLQALAELGVWGLALIVGLLVAAAIALARGLRGPERAAAAAAGAGFFAFALAAAIDWMWEMTVVGLIGVTLLAILTGPGAQALADGPPRRPRLSPPRLAFIAAAACLIAAQAIPYVAGTLIDQSQQEFRRGDLPAAASRAADARDTQPWAAAPWTQLALVREAQGRFHDAGVAIGHALSLDRGDWRLWLTAGRIDREAGHPRRAVAEEIHARSLNPQSPIFSAGR